MIDLLRDWFVIQGVNDGVNYFWSTPVGIVSILTILISSLILIYRTKPDFIESCYYWTLSSICTIALLHVHEGSNPRQQLMVIVLAIAVYKIWCVIKTFRGDKR